MGELVKTKRKLPEIVKGEIIDITVGPKGFLVEKAAETALALVPGGKYLVAAYEAAKIIGPAVQKIATPLRQLTGLYSEVAIPKNLDDIDTDLEWLVKKVGADDYAKNGRSVVEELKLTREAIEKGFGRTVVEVSLSAVVNDRRNSVEGKKAGKYRYQAACFAWLYKGCVVSWQWVNWEKAVFVSPSHLVTEFEVMPFNGVEGSWRAYVVPEDKKVPAKTGTFGK